MAGTIPSADRCPVGKTGAFSSGHYWADAPYSCLENHSDFHSTDLCKRIMSALIFFPLEVPIFVLEHLQYACFIVYYWDKIRYGVVFPCVSFHENIRAVFSPQKRKHPNKPKTNPSSRRLSRNLTSQMLQGTDPFFGKQKICFRQCQFSRLWRKLPISSGRRFSASTGVVD